MYQVKSTNEMLHSDILAMAEQSNANVVVCIYGKKMEFSIELLQGMAFKNMPTNAETLLLYCQKYGIDMEEPNQEPQFILCERSQRMPAMAV